MSPLVHVLIPVFNGEAFIADAIRSIQVQTYSPWILTVVNNQCTDRTRDVVQTMADADPRIRIHDNAKFLNVIENHSLAFELASPDAVYTKILDADDWLFPECLEQMVRVAEEHPTVGMVTSYVLSGNHVGFDGLPYPSTFLPGREVCRLRFVESVKCFGGPSASLIRSSVARTMRPFYVPTNYNGDTEAYLQLLQKHDFGFVHQVLSYNRRGEDSRSTSYLTRVNSYPATDVQEVLKYGPIFLTADELQRKRRDVWSNYYRFLANAVIRLPRREFWHYHFVYARGYGVDVNKLRLAGYVVSRILDLVLNPKRTLENIGRRLLG